MATFFFRYVSLSLLEGLWVAIWNQYLIVLGQMVQPQQNLLPELWYCLAFYQVLQELASKVVDCFLPVANLDLTNIDILIDEVHNNMLKLRSHFVFDFDDVYVCVTVQDLVRWQDFLWLGDTNRGSNHIRNIELTQTWQRVPWIRFFCFVILVDLDGDPS